MWGQVFHKEMKDLQHDHLSLLEIPGVTAVQGWSLQKEAQDLQSVVARYGQLFVVCMNTVQLQGNI